MCEVGDQVLGSFPAAEILELLEVLEVIPAVTEGHVVTVAGHGDVGGVLVEVAGGKDEGAINRRALGLMDGGGIAVIKVAVPGGIEGDDRTGIETDNPQHVHPDV